MKNPSYPGKRNGTSNRSVGPHRIWCGTDGWTTMAQVFMRVAEGVAAYAKDQPLKYRQAVRNHSSHIPTRKVEA
jgi:hypothetical protein